MNMLRYLAKVCLTPVLGKLSRAELRCCLPTCHARPIPLALAVSLHLHLQLQWSHTVTLQLCSTTSLCIPDA